MSLGTEGRKTSRSRNVNGLTTGIVLLSIFRNNLEKGKAESLRQSEDRISFELRTLGLHMQREQRE